YVAFDYRVRPDSLISRISTIEIHQEFRKRILLKHPSLHIYLLSSQLAAEQEHVELLSAKVEQIRDVLSSQLGAEQEHVRAVSATLAAEQERVRVLSVTVEQINHQVLERDQAIQTLFSHVAASQEHERALSEELARRDSELARIKGSRGWRLLESY